MESNKLDISPDQIMDRAIIWAILNVRSAFSMLTYIEIAINHLTKSDKDLTNGEIAYALDMNSQELACLMQNAVDLYPSIKGMLCSFDDYLAFNYCMVSRLKVH